MPLVPEDGSNVTGANSYATVAQFKAWADARGFSYDADDNVVEQHMLKAMDYIESKEDRFKGDRYYSAGQPLAFPRINICVNGVNMNQAIPLQLQAAQYQLTLDSEAAEAEGSSLFVNTDGRTVTKERVEGAVEVNYSEAGGTGASPVFSKAEALLSPLMEGSGGMGNFQVIR